MDEDENRIESQDVLERIRDLAIPPAWTDVWVCPLPNGHLQATGRDAAGRKQYLYHARWRERRDQQKFDEMIEFARSLPRLRRTIKADLAGEELGRRQALACALRMLDRGFFRIGSEDYAEQNDSFGLATLRRDHVRLVDGEVRFDYRAKGGQRRRQSINDPDVYRVVEKLLRRRSGGDELLAYREGRKWFDLTSLDINEYVKEVTGGDFSAKDFRTWNGTLLAAVALAMAEPSDTKYARKRAIAQAVKTVALFLGNTPAVSRASYIDPRVIDRYLSGWTIADALDGRGDAFGLEKEASRRRIEAAVIDLITEPLSGATRSRHSGPSAPARGRT
jgi:DNA topoisomerase IB